MTDTPAKRLAALRRAMLAHGIDAWLVPSADPHLSEYLPEHFQGRAWLSGFTGSAGVLLLTQHFAGLWVDSRYWVQAAQALEGTGIEMMKATQGLAPIDWLAEQEEQGEKALTLGFDAALVSLADRRRIADRLGPRAVLIEHLDLLDDIWLDRPALPEAPVVAHAEALCEAPRGEHLRALRQAMKAHGASAHLLSSLDDIAWLFNLRGADVAYNPVFLAHALIDEHSAHLFIDRRRIEAGLAAELARDGVTLHDYAAVHEALSALPVGTRLLLDPARVVSALTRRIGEGVNLVEAAQPTTLFKAQKTSDALARVAAVMARDGRALCRFFCRFETAMAHGETLTELDVDAWLTAERAKEAGFVSRSFPTIAGFNANGALPHYRATDQAHAAIRGDGLLLIDSGGQYEDGTTDITRMVAVGHLTPAQRRDCTLVLKGLIALSTTRFPDGLEGPRLDAIARAPLWVAGLDYGHGTGHGVGYFLNVHEGPQVISKSAQPTPQTALREGMITSIEPGIYRPGQWGVRLENLVANRRSADHPDFLDFETLTLCPFDTRCLAPDLLTEHETAWLDAYHARVHDTLAPGLDDTTRAWLEARTAPLAG